MKKKIKLIFFHPYSYIGGADNSLYRLIKNLDLNKFSITFVSLNKSYLKNILSKKILFKTITVNRSIYAIPKLRIIIKDCHNSKKFQKIILISNQNFANIISSFSTLYIPFIKKIFIDRNHLDELNFHKNFKEKFKKKIIKFLIWFTYSNADIVVGVSKKLSNDLANFIKRKVKTIYSPSFDKTIIQKSKTAVKLSNKFRYIINISRFSKRKDHETTLKAFCIIQKRLTNVRLILIGYGAERKNIFSLAKHLRIYNKIIIINKTLNPYPYIRRSSLLILTSIYEGFPNVLVESITIGTPVISTNMNSGASEILLNGKGGELIKVGDYLALSKKILQYFKNPKKLIKKISIAKINFYKFETINHAKIYTNIFKKI